MDAFGRQRDLLAWGFRIFCSYILRETDNTLFTNVLTSFLISLSCKIESKSSSFGLMCFIWCSFGPWDESVYAVALSGGNARILQWLREVGCRRCWSELGDVGVGARWYGHTPIRALQYLLGAVCETWIVTSTRYRPCSKSSEWSRTTCGFQHVKCQVESMTNWYGP